MQATETAPSARLTSGPEIWCPELPAFNEADLAAVQHAFRAVKPCQLLQAWQPEVSAGFAPASVQVGRRAGWLLVFATLTDQDIFSHATEINQRMWELGDAFEIFLRPADQTAYFQLDLTPNNQRMQLQITSAEALRRAQTANEFAELVLPGAVVRSAVWVTPEKDKWFVYAAISAEATFGRGSLSPERQWHFSFSRYDHTRGQLEPVISSTSPHARADFHRQQEWGVIHFAQAPIS